jgi:Family of unknown function (DUF6636)
VVALLIVLAFALIGSAAASPSAVDTSSSGVSEFGSAASGQSAKAEAVRAVRRLGLRDISSTYPVWKVVCGAFTGAGSETMVASINGDGNLGMLYWAVFEWTGSEWQFLMKQRQAAILTAAGSDIRETVSIYLIGDPRCCPSGGTKERIWHWSGSRFAATVWKQVTSGTSTGHAGASKSGYFKTPSGNIVCAHTQPLVVCGIKSGLKPAPPRSGRLCNEVDYQGDRVKLSVTGRASAIPCSGDAGPYAGESIARVLGYGKTWSGGGIRCTSAITGLTCRNKSGHGFFLSREHWRAF